MAFITTRYEPVELDGPREKLSRLLAITGVIYGLIATLVGATAVAGVLGLAGLAADPDATRAARMLGLPWSLAAGDPATQSAATALLLTLGALGLNLATLLLAARLLHGRPTRS